MKEKEKKKTGGLKDLSVDQHSQSSPKYLKGIGPYWLC
jgi:hypothetical protein